MDKIGLFIASSSREFIQLFSDKLALSGGDIRIKGSATDGISAAAAIERLRPDVLLLDLILPEMDGLTLLRRLGEREIMPKTVAISSFINDRVAASLSSLGVSFFYAKPCRAEELINSIRDCYFGQESIDILGEYDISGALTSFGIMPHLQGYRYLREAVAMALKDMSALHGITKIRYPDIAKHFHTTPQCVERSMRTAIQKAWTSGRPEVRRRYFGAYFDNCEKAPTNGRLIAAIAEFLEYGVDFKAGY